MELSVKEIDEKKKVKDNETITTHKLVLKGDNSKVTANSYNTVKIEVTITSEDPKAIEKWCKLDEYEKRVIELKNINQSLDNFTED